MLHRYQPVLGVVGEEFVQVVYFENSHVIYRLYS